MDHNAYEKEMIDGVNRHAEQATVKNRVFTNADVKTLKRGLKHILISILTTILFGLSVYSFIATATVTGYWAVVLFFSAIVLMVWAFILLYAQGIVDEEREGGIK